MNRRHLLYMVIGCTLPIVAVLAMTVFQIQPGPIVILGLLLLCPTIHLLMLREHLGHGENHRG